MNVDEREGEVHEPVDETASIETVTAVQSITGISSIKENFFLQS